MLQEVVIKATADESLKPLLEFAMRNQLKALEHGIARTKERIAQFEQRGGMSAAEFEKKLQANEIPETMDSIDWSMELAALRLLEGQYQSLGEAEID